MAKTMKKAELESLLHEVEGALSDALKLEAQKLSKANPGEETSDEPPADDSATDTSKDGPPASASGPPDAPPASASPADSAPPADGPPPPDASAPAGADPAADASADPQALQDEYSKLGQTDPEALKNHYLACKAALFALMGAGADGSAPPGAPPGPPTAAPPAPPMGPPAGSPPPDAAPAMKAEIKSQAEANGGKEIPVAKSEQDKVIETLNATITKHELALEGLMKVVEKICDAPLRKAITSISQLAPETAAKDITKMTRDEVKARLRAVAETPLKKSDRSLINQFDIGQIGVAQVAHLLTVTK